MDVLAWKIASRFIEAVTAPSRSPRAPTKFQPRVKVDDEGSDITEVTKESIEREATEEKEAVIRKEKGEYCVRSPNNPNWNGGCYKSKGEAEKRLKQVEFFKRQADRVALRFVGQDTE